MILTYLSLILKRAFERSFRLTDQLSVFAALAVPAIIKLWGRSVVETWGDYVAIGILTFVGSVIVLRLLRAPYVIWCEQNSEIADLRTELERPEQIERHTLAGHLGAVRAELASELAEIGQKAAEWEVREGNTGIPLQSNRAFELINQLSYDEPLASLCREYLQLCRIVSVKRHRHEDAREDSAALSVTGKKVFSLLHRATPPKASPSGTQSRSGTQ